MIIWIASYPKSGNTWLRSILTSYFFSKDGIFNFGLLENIKSFPSARFFKRYPNKFSSPESTAKYWINEQMNINSINKNKLIFLKTHNAMCKINGHSFTDSNNSLGAIYIVRDPRNVVTSISNHYEKNQSDALKFMKTKNQAIIQKINDRYLSFNALFSWSFHQKSWSECKKFSVLTIKYEDLEKDPYFTIQKTFNFIKKISGIKDIFNEQKAKTVIESCNFNRLQKLEEENGFSEAVTKKESMEKIKFFNLGKKNDYKNILNKNIIDEMNSLYEGELKKYNYK